MFIINDQMFKCTTLDELAMLVQEYRNNSSAPSYKNNYVNVTLRIHHYRRTFITYVLPFNQDKTISELFDYVELFITNNFIYGGYYININSYYKNTYSVFLKSLPYAIINDRIIFNITPSEVMLRDFTNTFNLDNEIIVDLNLPCGGDFLIFSELYQLWQVINEVHFLEAINLLIGTYHFGKAVYSFLLNRSKKFNSSQQNSKYGDPINTLLFISTGSAWDEKELANLLDINVSSCEHLLTDLGYNYDTTQKLYVKGSNTNERIELFSEELKKYIVRVETF